jgi:hypothetical protein
MTSKEAFDFLELPETATKIEIKLRLVEKLEYFEHLSENATSDFLRRINARNVDKVKQVQQEFFPWSLTESGSEVILPLEAQDELPAADEVFTTPIIVASGSRQVPVVPSIPQPVGWLIKHMENTEASHFPIFAGKNYLGRKMQVNQSPFIALEDDLYISRVHAVIYVEEGTPPACYIVDAPEANQGKASANGTYLNGNPVRIVKKEKLQDDDTIQIGTTRLVFKYNTKKIKELVKDVTNREFIAPVALAAAT